MAIGAARAIAFLHDLEKPVIHGNIMSSKILIDRVSLAEFFLSTLCFLNCSHRHFKLILGSD